MHPLSLPPFLHRSLVISGSARKNGHTQQVLDFFLSSLLPDGQALLWQELSPPEPLSAPCSPHTLDCPSFSGPDPLPQVPQALSIAHLCDWKIDPYDYEGKNALDNFLPLMHRLCHYETWILASPVYWYSLSALMKIFLDRFTDLLYAHECWRGMFQRKSLVLISSSGGGAPEYFHAPVRDFCGYLKIAYKGHFDRVLPHRPGQAEEHNRAHLARFLESFGVSKT